MPSNVFDVTNQLLEFSREKTLATLAAIEQMPEPAKVLAWRPGPGRAHIGWQLLHVAITEELFATDRIKGTTPAHSDLVPRFRGGSTPDDDVPSVERIRALLEETRAHLRATLATLTEADLPTIPPALAARGINIAKVLQILPWHEAHHQGQAHITLNLYKAAHP
jgi:uncharacterized damage-inducible protein DinB